jgi:formylmethanofuran dehydrogenase subunit C
MSGGLTARLKSPLIRPADFGEVLVGSWAALSAKEVARRPVYLEGEGPVPLGDLFELAGSAEGRIQFTGDLSRANRLAAGLAEGEVATEGDVGHEAGMALAGGTLDIGGNAGPRAGAAPLGFKRGMTGGELIIRGSAGPEAGAGMRRGLIVITKRAGERAGLGMIAGTIVVLGSAGPETGLWSKRGSIVALGGIDPPQTYAYDCTYQPIVLQLMLTRLRGKYALALQRKHFTGFYRRYSGDMAELGKGEILQWTAK